MKARLIVAVVFIPLIFVIMYLLPPLAMPIAIAILSVIAVYELLTSTRLLALPRLMIYSMALVALIPFWAYSGSGVRPLLIALFLLLTLLFMEIIASKGQLRLESVALSFFAGVFIPFFLSAFVRIRALEFGNYYILVPFISAFVSDGAAFFVGITLGRHKLAPSLSPKKTIEGAVGGFVFAVLAMLLYCFIINRGFKQEADYLLFAIYGAVGAVFAQFGDLAFSAIKRQYRVKDFGWIFPGHGGVLDRFDSVLFTAPLTEIFILLLPAIGAAL